MRIEYTKEFVNGRDWTIIIVPTIGIKRFPGNRRTVWQILIVWLCFAYEIEWEQKRPQENP